MSRARAGSRAFVRAAMLTPIALVALVALVAPGCGGDDPVTPPAGDRTIDFPGDAATLQAAIDMAARGDTVLVGAGTHALDATLLFGAARAGVTLAGRPSPLKAGGAERPVLEFSGAGPVDGIVVASGVADVTIRGLTVRGTLDVGARLLGPGGRIVDCRIEGASTYAISCPQDQAAIVVEGNLLLDAGLFGVFCLGASPHVAGNTIVGAGDCGIYSGDSAPLCERNIIVGSANWGIACFGSPVPALSCNALFDNATADYSPSCVPGTGDFHADPIFCDAIEYAIAENSPCAPANSPTCGLIGAVGVGCTPP